MEQVTKAPASLAVALKQHCSVEGETSSEFMQQYKNLTDTDKAWFRDRFKIEFGYTFS